MTALPRALQLAFILLLVVVPGCATTANVNEAQPTDSSLSLTMARSQVTGAIAASSRAQQASVLENDTTILARFNDTPCDCPPFELLIEGRWQRHHLTANAAELVDLVEVERRAREQADAGLHPFYLINGRLSLDRLPVTNNNEYSVVNTRRVRELGDIPLSVAIQMKIDDDAPDPALPDNETLPETPSPGPTDDAGADPEGEDGGDVEDTQADPQADPQAPDGEQGEEAPQAPDGEQDEEDQQDKDQHGEDG